MDAEVIRLLQEAYKNEYKKFEHKNYKKGKKGLYQQILYPMLGSLMKLKCEKPSAEVVKERLQDSFDTLITVANSMQAILDKDPANVKLIDVLCVPFDPVSFLVDHKPVLNYCLLAVDTIKSLLKKSGIDEIEAERLWANLPENFVKRQNDALITLGQSLLQVSSRDTLQVEFMEIFEL